MTQSPSYDGRLKGNPASSRKIAPRIDETRCSGQGGLYHLFSLTLEGEGQDDSRDGSLNRSVSIRNEAEAIFLVVYVVSLREHCKHPESP